MALRTRKVFDYYYTSSAILLHNCFDESMLLWRCTCFY